jgi:DNA-binding LacI/PurR family transcriptional regulator
MRRKANLTDIARELNTTAATVFRALSNHSRISEKTKNSVHLAASKLNYKRNREASFLRSGTHLIWCYYPTSSFSDPWGTRSSWENNAFFDFTGNVLPGIDFMTHSYSF